MRSDDLHLKVDGITEAVCEVRFSAPQATEIIVARLVDAKPWRSFEQTRLPSADIPPQMRELNPTFRYQPSYELKAETGGAFLRAGTNSLSCHQSAPYRDWENYQPLIAEAVETIFGELQGVSIERVGLRYINLLNETDHFITRPHNLKLQIVAGDNAPVTDSFAVNYRRKIGDAHVCQIALATPDYTAGPIAEPFSIVVDVDVFTNDEVTLTEPASTLDWIEKAHTYLKDEFFSLWPEDILEKLKRD